ncbi:MAG TPA: hypothetical protein VFF73_26335 [Planctomycetota bacterium]|nr:hypothetical protein [Planctomycetota bacterium]
MRRASTAFLTALVMGSIIVGMCWRTALRAYAYERTPRFGACVANESERERPGPAVGMGYDARRLHGVSWSEPGIVAAAIENTEDHDLIFDLGVVFVSGFAFLGEDGNGFPGLVDESVPVRPIRLAARSVTLVRRRAKDLAAGVVSIPARLALASTANGKRTWVRVLERSGNGAAEQHVVRRGETLRLAWRPENPGGIDLIFLGTFDWLRAVDAPGGHVFGPREDRGVALAHLCAAMTDPLVRKDIAWNVEFREPGTVAASTSGSSVWLEIDTGKVHGHVFSPLFDHASYGANGHMTWSATTVGSPILVHDADESVVEEE